MGFFLQTYFKICNRFLSLGFFVKREREGETNSLFKPLSIPAYAMSLSCLCLYIYRNDQQLSGRLLYCYGERERERERTLCDFSRGKRND